MGTDIVTQNVTDNLPSTSGSGSTGTGGTGTGGTRTGGTGTGGTGSGSGSGGSGSGSGTGTGTGSGVMGNTGGTNTVSVTTAVPFNLLGRLISTVRRGSLDKAGPS
ncbi:MAG: hypothetical protein ACR2I2_05925 [Bryobacteraceae bacterium]